MFTGETLDCRDSKGGIKTIYIADLANVGTPTTASGVITAWTAANGDFWTYQVRPEVSNATFTANVSDANGTSFYTHAVNFTTYKMSGTKNQNFMVLAQKRVVIIVKANALDSTGTALYYVYGLNNGLNMTTSTGETGTAMGDLNGYKYAFTGSDEEAPYQLTASLITGLTT
jgi:hypothetical protein